MAGGGGGGNFILPSPPSSAAPIRLHQLSPGCQTPARSHLRDPAVAAHSCEPAPAQQLPDRADRRRHGAGSSS